MNQEDKFQEMARRNDVARKLGLGLTVTKKAAELPDLEELLYAVRSFNKFSTKDDPYGWHDLGRLEWRDQSVLWKIDYYDPTLHYFADPLSDDCKRVITVMLASEY
ncbi:MAG: DUF3768 domain-containing protein [Patescibacteria group bacterium]